MAMRRLLASPAVSFLPSMRVVMTNANANCPTLSRYHDFPEARLGLSLLLDQQVCFSTLDQECSLYSHILPNSQNIRKPTVKSQRGVAIR